MTIEEKKELSTKTNEKKEDPSKGTRNDDHHDDLLQGNKLKRNNSMICSRNLIPQIGKERKRFWH